MTQPMLNVGGQSWTGWTRVSVQYGAKQAVRAFALTAVDSSAQLLASSQYQWSFMPGAEVSITEGGQLFVKGFINKMAPSFSANNHIVEVSGRSTSQDCVDSTAEHRTGEFRKKNILQIAKELDKQNVGFSSDLSDSDMPQLEFFRVNPGEAVFNALQRIAMKQQLLLIGQPDGSVKIDKGGNQVVNAPLIEGYNIVGASASFGDEDKHSVYKVKGQRALGSDKSSIQIIGTAKDSSVKRNRPKHIHHGETDLDQQAADKRAQSHRDRQQGESITATVRVKGWRDENGQPYKENSLIPVHSPMLKLNMSLLISSVNCTMDESGSFTSLSLVQPQAFGSNANTGAGTDSAWQTGF